jgi:hypothetical protein
MILLGDILVPIRYRESPVERAEIQLNRFADPSGKAVGRLMMARDNKEMVTTNDVVYVDLGSEDQRRDGRLPH